MAFRVDYEKKFNHGDYSVSGGGVLKSGFRSYEEALTYVNWAKENLIHDSYRIVSTNTAK